jgi:hypothetical protein
LVFDVEAWHPLPEVPFRFRLWFSILEEKRYKSVIVESGTTARTLAAYIDPNPVRESMVADPAEYRWSSYGEAVGGGKKGNAKAAAGVLWSVRDLRVRI